MTPKVRTESDKRTNDILLGPLERPALKWLAAHMPAWVHSDLLTIVGAFGSALACFAYIMAGRTVLEGNWFLFLASFGFIVNWFGDSLDGSLARYRHQERPNYGYYTDHAIDGLTSIAMFIGIGLSGMARFDVSMFALSTWLLLMVQVYLKTHATGTFEMTSIKIGPTEVRLMAIALNTTLFFTGIGKPLFSTTLRGEAFEVTIGTLVVGVLGVLFLLYYIYQTLRTSRQLAIEDGEALKRRMEEEARKLAKEDKKVAKAETKAAKKNHKNQSKNATKSNA